MAESVAELPTAGACCSGAHTELVEIEWVAARHALVPLLKDEPGGVESLLQLAANSPSRAFTSKEI